MKGNQLITTTLEGKHILITGGAGGIGLATGLAAVDCGADSVTLVDVDEAALLKAGSIISERSSGASVLTLTADVTDTESVTGYVDATLDAFGRIDGFFNNAGISGTIAPIVDLDPEDFDRVIAVNLRGVFLGLRSVLPVMVKQGSGSIVCTGSLASERGLTHTSGYNAAKHGVLGLVRTAAAESGAAGVRVNAVEPGMIRTNMLATITKALDPEGDVDSGMEAAGALVSPIPRAGQPDEVAEGVIFLLSDASRYITGIGMPIDGGALAAMPHPDQ